MKGKKKLEAIDLQIKKKQEKLFKLKDESDEISDEIQKLIKEKEKIRKTELLEAIEASGRTYEEVMEFLKSAPDRSEKQTREKRKYRPRKPKSVD